MKIDLNGEWKFAWTEDYLEPSCLDDAVAMGLSFHGCTVPGNFELDLFKLGEIPDPFFGMNPVKVREKTEFCHIYYSRKFHGEALPSCLVFEGLDCFAEVYLNGKHVASCDNMLVEQRICISDQIVSGENEIFVHIRPANIEARKFDYPTTLQSLGGNFDSIYVRKAPHMYGWDIMPRFLSAGMYRPVYIESLSQERFEEAYLRTL